MKIMLQLTFIIEKTMALGFPSQHLLQVRNSDEHS